MANTIQSAPFDYESILIYYNEFKNSISFKIQSLELMPKKRFFKNFMRLTTYEVDEPDIEVSKHHYYDLYVACGVTSRLLLRDPPERRLRAVRPDERDGERLEERGRDP